MKTKIGIDVDGVLAIHYDRTIDYLNARYNVAVHPQELTTYYFEDYYSALFQLDRAEIKRFLGELLADPAYLPELAPSLPMIRACRELAGLSSDPAGPTIVTARRESTRALTKTWLDQYGIAYTAIVHTNEKAAYCREQKIKYFVEDAPHQAEAIAAVGCGVFLVDYPYNQSVAATGLNGIWRITNPLQIPHLIRADLEK